MTLRCNATWSLVVILTVGSAVACSTDEEAADTADEVTAAPSGSVPGSASASSSAPVPAPSAVGPAASNAPEPIAEPAVPEPDAVSEPDAVPEPNAVTEPGTAVEPEVVTEPDSSEPVSSEPGTATEPEPVATTMGCGASTWPTEENFTIDVDGTPREYIVSLPEGYDPAVAYRLIFAWHGRTGTAEQIARGFGGGGYYGLEELSAGSAIFVSGQGLGTDEDPADTGWPNNDGRDVAFVVAMLDWLKSNYCVDENRIFSVGMSYGGIMSNTLGCELGDVFRAIAPIAGAGPGFGRGAECQGPVAAWLTHGTADEVVTFESGEGSRDHWLEANGCSTETMPFEPEGCVEYQGCDADYPVVWCVHDGGHTVPGFSGEAIWDFFQRF